MKKEEDDINKIGNFKIIYENKPAFDILYPFIELPKGYDEEQKALLLSASRNWIR